MRAVKQGWKRTHKGVTCFVLAVVVVSGVFSENIYMILTVFRRGLRVTDLAGEVVWL